jgi:hypothetical protein
MPGDFSQFFEKYDALDSMTWGETIATTTDDELDPLTMNNSTYAELLNIIWQVGPWLHNSQWL